MRSAESQLRVHGWALERASELRHRANVVEGSWPDGDMGVVARHYAAGLREAADVLERRGAEILRLESEQAPGVEGKEGK